jgi:DNA-dependent RNA polymerase auxiliary subunit epsilon
MKMIKNFNIVYENWKGDEPIPNWIDIFPKRNLKDPYYLIHHYITDTEFENKFNLRRCNFDDVINELNENFYYFVNYGAGDLCELFENKEFGKPVEHLNPISDKLVNFIRENKNFNIVFLTEHEPDNEEGFRILN